MRDRPDSLNGGETKEPTMTDSDAPSPDATIRGMQAAAIERSMVDGTATEPHLVLVGALEGARRAARESGVTETTALTPAMTVVLTLFGVSRLSADGGTAPETVSVGGPPTPPMPPGDDRRRRLRVRGARVAYEMDACSLSRAASLAGVAKAEFESVEGRTSGVTDDR